MVLFYNLLIRQQVKGGTLDHDPFVKVQFTVPEKAMKGSTINSPYKCIAIVYRLLMEN